MRLTKLDLLAYGHFRGLSLDFSARAVHVVFGRNEAGKSTTLRAITGLLYGIPAKTPDGHAHKLADLRIGGAVEGKDGERVRLVRRKGNTNTLLDDQGQAIDETALKRLLGGVTEETFRLAYGLDHEALGRGARALLEGKGDLGESLFDASVGGGGEVQKLIAELANEADRIYKPRASSLPLNDALKAFADAQKAVRERQTLPEAFVTQQEALTSANEHHAQAVSERNTLAAKKARIDRARMRLPLEKRRDLALAKHGPLGALAEAAPRIDALKERFGAYERAWNDRAAHLKDVERLAEAVAVAARRAGVASEAEALRLDMRTEGRVQALLRDRTAIGERLENAAIEIARLDRDLARYESSEPTQVTAAERRLAAALERARALGDIEARIATEAAKAARKRKELETKAKALFSGPLDALPTMRVPARETVEALDERATEAERAISRLLERIEDLESEGEALETQIASNTGDFAPPEPAALEKARVARDEAWSKARAAEGKDRAALELKVERLVHDADALADRMIREADRVTTLARLRSEKETNEKQLAKTRKELSRAEASRSALDGDLAKLFSAPKLAPPESFAETTSWLDRHADILEKLESLHTTESEIETERTKAAAATAELEATTAELTPSAGVEPIVSQQTIGDRPPAGRKPIVSQLTIGDRLAEGGEGASLFRIIASAGHALEGIEERRRAAVEAARIAGEKRAKREEHSLAKERNAQALAEVAAKLAEVLRPLGIPTDASADEVNRGIEAFRELFDIADKRSAAVANAKAADADVRVFEADLARALEVATDLRPLDPRDAARTLFARSAEAKENARELAEVTTRLAEIEDVGAEDIALAADSEGIEKLEARIAEVDGEITRLNRDIGGIRAGLDAFQGNANAADSAAVAQQELARIRENAERWARVKLASVILGREIERYREENQGPLLAAASSLFSRLTLGAYSGVKSGFDAHDKPCLLCVRSGTEVEVTGLSDGTRDQLYLALRLSSLLRRAEVGEPMPLVLDDVLIQLDDERASAALKVLAEVSQKMQVLFFTHHARLVDLAKSAIPKGELVVHELEQRPVTAPYTLPAS